MSSGVVKCHLKKLKRKNVTLVTQATWLDCCCLQYQKKEIVTGRDIAAAWQIALLAITYDGRFVLTQLILGDQSVLKRVFLSRRQTPTVWFQTYLLFGKLTITHTLTSRELPGIVLRISHRALAHRWCMTHCTCPCSSASAAYVHR